MSVLECKGATMRFGGVTAVDNLNLQVNKGEIVALIGPNGAGKTTAFNMITGVYTPTSGDIFFEGKRLNKMRPDKITGLGIARTFQNIRLFKALPVLDNVLIANHLHLKGGLFADVLFLSQKQERAMREKTEYLLERTGLIDFKNDMASSLPYGLQRRLEIARALATDPALLLLDEPAAGMNPKESEDLTTFIREVRDEFSLSVLLIEHHMQVVMDISERIYVLDYGVTIAQGTPYEIQNNEDVIRAYLGVDDE